MQSPCLTKLALCPSSSPARLSSDTVIHTHTGKQTHSTQTQRQPSNIKHRSQRIYRNRDTRGHRGETQRCSLTRCKTKLVFAHFISKSGLIIIMGVWELPYNLWKVLRITQNTPQQKRNKYKYLQLFSSYNTRGTRHQITHAVWHTFRE